MNASPSQSLNAESSTISNRPEYMIGSFEDYSTEDIHWVVSQFQVQEPIQIGDFPGKGNINLHTYEVVADGKQYLLQKVNSSVFAFPYRVMNGMCQSIAAQRGRQQAEGLYPDWYAIELVPTRTGKEYLDLTDEHGWSVWRLMVRIPNCLSFKSLGEVEGREEQLRIAAEIGKGLAIYTDLTSQIPCDGFEGSLPGYRDTALYYAQFHSVLAGNRSLGDAVDLLPQDPLLRTSAGAHFLVALPEEEYQARLNDPEIQRCIELLLDRQAFTMQLWTAIESGAIRRTLIHGDTKIENFLFDRETQLVKSLVDLDTIMSFTWLADYGDMLRSMVNVAGEKERNRELIQVETEVLKAVTQGFLENAAGVTEPEIRLMYTSIQVITLELGLRFLTDYLKGDTYFSLTENDPHDLNKVRALAQITLFERLEEFRTEAEEFISSLRPH